VTKAQVTVTVTEEALPPHHFLHGTPNTVVNMLFRFELPAGVAEVDRTDYGHPGKFNPCHARNIPGRLRERTDDLLAIAESLSALL
jgi:hypothetical protein